MSQVFRSRCGTRWSGEIGHRGIFVEDHARDRRINSHNEINADDQLCIQYVHCANQAHVTIPCKSSTFFGVYFNIESSIKMLLLNPNKNRRHYKKDQHIYSDSYIRISLQMDNSRHTCLSLPGSTRYM